MDMIEQVRITINSHKQELSVKRRIAQAEFDKELEMLMKADKWISMIEEELNKKEKE